MPPAPPTARSPSSARRTPHGSVSPVAAGGGAVLSFLAVPLAVEDAADPIAAEASGAAAGLRGPRPTARAASRRRHRAHTCRAGRPPHAGRAVIDRRPASTTTTVRIVAIVHWRPGGRRAKSDSLSPRVSSHASFLDASGPRTPVWRPPFSYMFGLFLGFFRLSFQSRFRFPHGPARAEMR